MHTDPRSAHLIDSNCPKQMGCKRMSTLHHHCTGAWCPACPPPGLHRSKVTLSSHTCFFVMACSTISNSFRGRQRALVQVSGWERPFLCSVGEGKGLYYFITERLGEVKWHLGLASICLHAGGSSRQSSGLGWRVKEEWKKEGMPFSRVLSADHNAK